MKLTFKINKFFWVYIIISLIVVSSISFGIYFFVKYKNISSGEESKIREAEQLFEKVSKVYLINGDEKPSIAIVKDPSIFKGQEFFNNALEGDSIFIFSSVKRAILFRPSISKIIDIAPLSEEDLKINQNNSGILNTSNILN